MVVAKQIPLMLAKRWDQIDRRKVEYPVFIEPKIDGLRLISRKHGKEWKVITRYGHEVAIEDVGLEDGVYDGEVYKPGVEFNKMSGEIRKGDLSGIVVVIFDYLTIDEWDNRSCLLKQHERRKRLEGLRLVKPYELIETELVYSEAEVDAAFEVATKELGLEGIMIKESKALYRWDRGGKWYKYKKKDLEDAYIIGFVRGTGKYADALGAVVVKTENGRTYHVGSGFSEKERYDIWRNRKKYLGKWIEVEFYEKTKEAVRMPRFKRFKL